MPSKNHRIKKLGHLYLEVVEKNKDDPTLILVCNALMRSLVYYDCDALTLQRSQLSQ